MTNPIPTTDIFTSCTTNYIPKARILGKSLQQFHPDLRFHLVLSDAIPDSIVIENEPFDSIITVSELDIPNIQQWLFKHSVVELCTAVKGMAFNYIFNLYKCDRIIYFDPDIAIFSPLDELISNFDNHSILLTPHQLEPEKSPSAIIDNEICFLRYGTFNLGFVGVKNSDEGKKFVQWWSNRCLYFCYDDTPNALFTDQRWIDLAPSFFTDIAILRHAGYNVANWNLSNRHLTGNMEEGIQVNQQPLCFYHFSNSQNIMPEKYNLITPTITSLLQWYKTQGEYLGQKELSVIPCVYSFFDNGEAITQNQRIIYRQREDLQQQFPNPFEVNEDSCYYNWYQEYEKTEKLKGEERELIRRLENDLAESQALISGMESSKFWKIRQSWFAVKKMFGLEKFSENND